MKLAVVIPAFNEALSIAATMEDFAREAPDCELVVVDNNSTDGTGERARETLERTGMRGRVFRETRQGKSYAVRRAFAETAADLYVLVDADSTYRAADLARLAAPVRAGEADMTVGDRHAGGEYARQNRRPFHSVGNELVRRLINLLFRSQLRDILSGYRCFSARFVKNLPILSGGFELETELTLHALDKRFRILELPVSYAARPEGSVSKLNTYRDGYRVLSAIFAILRYNRPFAFFATVAGFFFACGAAVGAAPVVEFYQTKRILHIPDAILATGLMVCSLINVAIALILDMVARQSRQSYELRLLHWRPEARRE